MTPKTVIRIALVATAGLLLLLTCALRATSASASLRLMAAQVEAGKDPMAVALTQSMNALTRECRSLAEQGRSIDGTRMSLALRMQYDERVREQQGLAGQHARLTRRIALSRLRAAELQELVASEDPDGAGASAELDRRQQGGTTPLTGADLRAEGLGAAQRFRIRELTEAIARRERQLAAPPAASRKGGQSRPASRAENWELRAEVQKLRAELATLQRQAR